MPSEPTPTTPALVTPLRRRSWIRPLLIALAVWVLLQSWQSYHARQAAVSLAALAKPGDIVMLSSETCAYCKAANRFMTQHQIPFSECFIETDVACAERYRAQQSPGTPTLLVRGQRLVGFDPERIAQVLGGA